MVYFKTLKWTDAIAEFDIAMNLMETKHKKPVAIYMFKRAQAYEYSGNLEKAREQYKLTCSLAKMGCERLD
jgi:hypothetical protein